MAGRGRKLPDVWLWDSGPGKMTLSKRMRSGDFPHTPLFLWLLASQRLSGLPVACRNYASTAFWRANAASAYSGAGSSPHPRVSVRFLSLAPASGPAPICVAFRAACAKYSSITCKKCFIATG